MYSLTILEARSMQSKCGEGMLVLEALGEFPFFASLLSSPSSRHSLASGSKTQFSASVFTRPILVCVSPPFLQGNSALHLVFPNQGKYLRIFNLIPSTKSFFQISLHSQIPGGHIFMASIFNPLQVPLKTKANYTPVRDAPGTKIVFGGSQPSSALFDCMAPMYIVASKEIARTSLFIIIDEIIFPERRCPILLWSFL